MKPTPLVDNDVDVGILRVNTAVEGLVGFHDRDHLRVDVDGGDLPEAGLQREEHVVPATRSDDQGAVLLVILEQGVRPCAREAPIHVAQRG